MTRARFNLAMALFSLVVLGSLTALLYVDPPSGLLAGSIGLPALISAWILGDSP